MTFVKGHLHLKFWGARWPGDQFSDSGSRGIVILRTRWLCPNMTEKLFTETLRIIANQHLKFKISVSQKPLCIFHQILYVSSYVHCNENLVTRCWKHDQDGYGTFRILYCMSRLTLYIRCRFKSSETLFNMLTYHYSSARFNIQKK